MGLIKHFIKHINVGLKLFVFVNVLILGQAFAGSYEDFFRAVKRDDSSAIQRLLNRGFEPDTPDPQGVTGLMMALQEPSPKVAQVLIDWAKTNLNADNSSGETPLMMAALKGEFELARKLIAKDAAVNKTGWTPLHYAATAGDVKMISLLIENHAFIDAESPNRSTPLMMACMYGSPDAVRLLLAEGADTAIKNQQGLSATDFAERADRPDIAELVRKFENSRKPSARPSGKW